MPMNRARIARLGIAALSVATGVATAAAAVYTIMHPPMGRPELIGVVRELASAAFCALSFALVVRRDTSKDETLLASALTLTAIASSVPGAITILTGLHPAPLDWVVLSLMYIPALGAFLRFTAIFPSTLTAEHPRAAFTRDVSGALRAFLMRPRQFWITTAAIFEAAFLFAVTVQPDSTAATVVGYVGILGIGSLLAAAAVANMRMNYERLPLEQRSRVLWVLAAFATAGALVVAWPILVTLSVLFDGFGGNILLNTVDFLLPVARVAFVGCLAMATFFSGAFNPRHVIRGAAWSTILGTIGLFTFAAVENVLTNVVSGTLGAGAAWVAAGCVALASKFAIGRVKRLVERRSGPQSVLGDGHQTDPESRETEPRIPGYQ